MKQIGFKSFSVRFTDDELSLIEEACKKEHRTRASFIQHAALSLAKCVARQECGPTDLIERLSKSIPVVYKEIPE